MPPRTLATLAHALSVAPDVRCGAARARRRARRGRPLRADRAGAVRRAARDARRPARAAHGDTVDARPARDDVRPPADARAHRHRGGRHVRRLRRPVRRVRRAVRAERSFSDVGWLALRGLRFDGQLSAVIVLYETRKFFGTRTSERLAPSVALFELAYRALPRARGARGGGAHARGRDAARARRVRAASSARSSSSCSRRRGPQAVQADPERLVALEREAAQGAGGCASREPPRRRGRGAGERGRRAAREGAHRAASPQRVAPPEDAHALSDRSRAHARCDDRRSARDGERAAHARRRRHGRAALLAPAARAEEQALYLAAARGIAPNVPAGLPHPDRRGRGGQGRGDAGSRCSSRTSPRRRRHPLLRDEYFTTGSFISFPLVYHGELVGVVNLTNRAMQGIFVDEDVERVRLLGARHRARRDAGAAAGAHARDAECRLARSRRSSTRSASSRWAASLSASRGARGVRRGDVAARRRRRRSRRCSSGSA